MRFQLLGQSRFSRLRWTYLPVFLGLFCADLASAQDVKTNSQTNHWRRLWSSEPLYIDDEYEMFIGDLPEKLPPWSAYTNKYDHMDWAHDWIFLIMQKSVAWADTYFVKEGEERQPIPVSLFDIAMEMRYKDEVGGPEWTVEPDFNISINLPNLENKFQIYVTSEPVDELPGIDASERTGDARIGFRRMIGPFVPSFGIKIKTPPELFVESKFQWSKEWKGLQAHPLQKFYWESDDGFGLLSSITMDKWNGRTLFRSASSGKWAEDTIGYEWEQTFVLSYAWKMIRQVKFERRASIRDLAMGIGLRASIFGHKSGSGIVDRYRLTLPGKIPMCRNWLFFVVAPELEFRNVDDWKNIPGVKFGLQAIFWSPELDDWTAF